MKYVSVYEGDRSTSVYLKCEVPFLKYAEHQCKVNVFIVLFHRLAKINPILTVFKKGAACKAIILSSTKFPHVTAPPLE